VTNGPATGRLWIRWRGRDATLPEDDFERLVRAGLVPEDAWIISPAYTQGHAIQARDLEVYYLWRPDVEEDRPPAAAPFFLTEVLRRRSSITLVLTAANLVVALVLLLRWGAGYPYALADWATRAKLGVRAWWDLRSLVPTTFVHASPSHLFGNLLYLVVFGTFVEYGLGAWRMTLIYLASGAAGAIASYLFADISRLSVGASGAIFGLIGASFAFLVRHEHDFHRRLRWRSRRVFIPMVLSVAAYSLASGNFLAHGGGFVAGLAIAILVDRRPPAALLKERSVGPSP
jgi:membrane associated rhomboid family serine protease